ncbi:MAG: hypothetical protein J6J01_05810 [Oscillospiraceae bacterium]|nr:hypothetical protein [Oscillospiraceae bacterium]
MSEKRTFSPPVVVGAVSLLTIFAVLCLTVFALLSLSTVQADERLSDKSFAAVAGYYAADCAAEEILAQLRAGEIPEGVTAYEGGLYRYGCPISDTQTLVVEVAVEDTDYTIIRWQARSTADWVADDSLPVWDGGSMQEE